MYIVNKTSEAILHMFKSSRGLIREYSNRHQRLLLGRHLDTLMLAAFFTCFNMFDVSVMPRKSNLHYWTSRKSLHRNPPPNFKKRQHRSLPNQGLVEEEDEELPGEHFANTA